MTTADLQQRIRIFIYTDLADRGAPPTASDIARKMSISSAEARTALDGLARNREVILDPSTHEIWMAGPFSAVPTRYRVHGAQASWWANCGWDMLGIPAALEQSVRIDATCADCDEPMSLDVDRDSGPTADDAAIVHILLPAREWYADIGFT